MRLRNEIFATVLDWLVKNEYVKDQKELAEKMKISQNTISRIMTDKVEPKDETLRKLNAAFNYIFNMQYLRGEDLTHMLIEDLVNERENQMLGNQDKQNEANVVSLESYNNELRQQLKVLNETIFKLDSKINEHQNRIIELETDNANLKGKLEAKEEHIRDLRSEVDDKRIEIHSKNEELKSLRELLQGFQTNPIKDYHFPVGVADKEDNKRINPLT